MGSSHEHNHTQHRRRLTSRHGEQALWIAVLSGAVHDATMRLTSLTSYNNIMLRENARTYLRGDSNGFKLVCDYAGVEPARVRAALELAISRDKHEARNNAIAAPLSNPKEKTMAGSVNKVILVGNLGRDPEVRTFQNGNRVCNFSIATGESWKDKTTGERKQVTEWHNIVILNDSLVNVASQYLKKGAKVFIEGKMKTRKYTDKDGVEKYTTEVVVGPFGGELTMLDSKEDSGASPYDRDSQYSASTSRAAPAAKAQPQQQYNDLDDEVPF